MKTEDDVFKRIISVCMEFERPAAARVHDVELLCDSLKPAFPGDCVNTEEKAKELREHLRGLVNMGFANFDADLDLLDYLLGDKCTYVYDKSDLQGAPL